MGPQTHRGKGWMSQGKGSLGKFYLNVFPKASDVGVSVRLRHHFHSILLEIEAADLGAVGVFSVGLGKGHSLREITEDRGSQSRLASESPGGRRKTHCRASILVLPVGLR